MPVRTAKKPRTGYSHNLHVHEQMPPSTAGMRPASSSNDFGASRTASRAATGCGMCAVPLKGLQKDDLSLEQLQMLQKLIKRRIPTGADRCSTLRRAGGCDRRLSGVAACICTYVDALVYLVTYSGANGALVV